MLEVFDPQNLANLAWAFAIFGILNTPLMDAISAQAILKIQQYSTQELANTAWAFYTLTVQNQPLWEAISSQALRSLDSMQTQALMFLIDVDLPCHETLKIEVSKVVQEFAEVVLLKQEEWDADQYKAAVWNLRVDSFGTVGSRMLWDLLRVCAAPDNFCSRAEQEIEKVGAEDRSAFITDMDDQVSGRKHQRVFAYAEYDIEPLPGETEIRGQMLFENGFRGVRADVKWLKHTPLPVSSWVDRSLCAEMQMMTTFCSQLIREGLCGEPELNHLLRGNFLVYTSIPPCLSCVGVLRQFTLRFPGIKLQFSNGSGCRLESFMKR